MNARPLSLVTLLVFALGPWPCLAGATSLTMQLSSRQLARAGDEVCVWLDLQSLGKAGGLKESPAADAISLRDGKGGEMACGVFEDINPFRPAGSRCYVVWRKPKGGPGPATVSVLLDASAQPARDPAVQGVNWLKNPGFEAPGKKGARMPPHWGSFQLKPGTVARSDEMPRSGRFALRLTNAPAKGKGVYFSQAFGIPPELADRRAVMFLRFYQKVAKGAAGSGAFCRVRRWSKGGFAGDLGRGMVGPKDAKGWTPIRAAGQLAPGVRRVDLHMGAYHGAPLQTTFFDDFEMQLAPLSLADLFVNPRMVFPSEGVVHVTARVLPGKRLFVGHAVRLVNARGAASRATVLLRQDLTAEELKAAEVRVSLRRQGSGKTLAQAAQPLRIGERQTFSLPVKRLAPGKYEVSAEVAPKGAGPVPAASATVEVEPDPFQEGPAR